MESLPASKCRGLVLTCLLLSLLPSCFLKQAGQQAEEVPYHLVFSYKDGSSGDGTVSLDIQIPWKLQHGWAGETPNSPVRSDAELEELTLIPYGCTNLRVTEFPVLERGEGAQGESRNGESLAVATGTAS